MYMTNLSRRKIGGDEETAEHTAVFVRTGIQHTGNFDSGERVKTTVAVADAGNSAGCPSRSTLELDEGDV
jgi:hypothetical protein